MINCCKHWFEIDSFLFSTSQSINIDPSDVVGSATNAPEIADDNANTEIRVGTPAIDVVGTTVQKSDSDLEISPDGKATNVVTIEPTTVSDEHCAGESVIVTEEPIGDDIASLDAAVAKLNSEVLSLRQQSEAKARLDEIVQAAEIASLDAAVAKLNSEVRDLVRQSSEDVKGTSGGAIPKIRENQYFDYSLYRESSTSPPPHPLTTYRWEDIKREKEKVQRELTVICLFRPHATPSIHCTQHTHTH